ncbi:MAG: electron transport complex subunit RsxG [Gammaproteobacteria bacterium]
MNDIKSEYNAKHEDQHEKLPKDSLPANPFSQAIFSMGGTLAAFALGTIFVCMLTYQLSLPRIEDNQRRALENTLEEVFPRTQFDNDLLSSVVEISGEPLSHSGTVTLYRATLNGSKSGLILPVAAPEGYGGTIRLLVGIDPEGVLTGVRVLPPHPETPGLGDAIEVSKSDWIRQFTGKSLHNPEPKGWAVKKDGGNFDSFTGATITPRAVVKAVKSALIYFEQEGKLLLEQPTDPTASLSKPKREEDKP